MESKLKITLFGNSFYLKIVYDCYTGEKITAEQKTAADLFTKHLSKIKNAEDKTIEYCRNILYEIDLHADKKEIVSSIIPEYLFVKRDDENCRVAIRCNFNLDPENDLAIVFDTTGNVTVGPQSMIL